MAGRQRLSLLCVSLLIALSATAPTAQPRDVMTPVPDDAVLAALDADQGVPDAACVANCAAARDRAVAWADKTLADKQFFSVFDSNCTEAAGQPKCATLRQACREACRPKYENSCLAACEPAFQTCCHANKVAYEATYYEQCVAQCPKRAPVAPPEPPKPTPPPPPPPPTGGAGTGAGGAKASSTIESVLTSTYETWMQVPKYADVIDLLSLRGPLLDAFVIGPDGSLTINLGRTRPMPAFLEDRVHTGPPFAVIDDTTFTQAGIREIAPQLTEAEVINLFTQQVLLTQAFRDMVKDRSFIQYQAGPTCGTPERLEQVRRVRQSASIASTCFFAPNTSLRETLETLPSGSPNVGSSEHGSVRGTINGSGDFIDMIPEPPPDIRTPAVLALAARRVMPQTTPRTQLVMPGVVVTGIGGNADVIADLGQNGIEAIVCLKGAARVRDVAANSERTVNAGEAVVVLPGRGISTPRRLATDRLTVLSRPVMIGSRVLKPGAELRVRPLLNGRLTLDARMVTSQPNGGAYALEVGVGNSWLQAAPLNKGERGQWVNGRVFEYRDPVWDRWLVFASPDFRANQSAAGGFYQLMTEPGQAYRYVWDISRAAPPGTRADLRIRNAHETLPMEVRVYR